MDVAALVELLDQPQQAAHELASWKVNDVDAAHRLLVELADVGLPFDLIAELCCQLTEHLPPLAAPDAAVDTLRLFIFASRSPLSLLALLERDASALPMLLRVLTTSAPWRDLLIRDPEAFDLLRLTDGQPISRKTLLSDICREVGNCGDEAAVLAALRRIKGRELLRIGYGDVFQKQRFELVVEQLTFLYEALIEAALQAARRKLDEQRSASRRANGTPVKVCVLAFDRLGAGEMDYASPAELLLIHDAGFDDEPGRRTTGDYFDRLGRLIARYLMEPTPEGAGMVLGSALQSPSRSALPVWSRQAALNFFDSFGRTWHRQTFTRARAVAGDLAFGQQFLAQLQPWVYRQYLNRADETGIKALKRRIERRAQDSESLWRDVAQARGSARDIEAVVEFLQLLNGGDLPSVRGTSIFAAISGLEQAGVLTVEERHELEQNYEWLRRLEHHLQIRGVAPAVEEICAHYRERLDRSWSVLARLLASAFPDEPVPPPEVDLLLDPVADHDDVERILGAYGFADTRSAFDNLQDLADEQIPFLSTRHCRDYLAAIVRPLLSAVAHTPAPDYTLSNLTRVSASLGGKGVLWELFCAHRASLELYVRLCGASPYLSQILTSNPGMIDELVDSLQLSRLPSRADLAAALAELARGRQESLLILHGFKNASHLQIGVRDILDKEDVDALHQSLSDVAELCIANIAQRQWEQVAEKHGEPVVAAGVRQGERCRFTVLGLGKLGASEPNYHSAVELAFVFEAEGTTRATTRGNRAGKTTNQHFFTQLAQRILKELTQLTPQGRLYNAELPLRSPGNASVTARSLADLGGEFTGGAVPLSHWQSLCKARSIGGEQEFGSVAEDAVRRWIVDRIWTTDDAAAIRAARLEQDADPADHNLKRSPGGTLDIEVAVQLLQLRHAAQSPAILVPGTLKALAALAAAGHLSGEAAEAWSESYRFLRRVESALRLLNSPARHNLPSNLVELRKVALLLQYSDPLRLREESRGQMAANRERFERLFDANS